MRPTLQVPCTLAAAAALLVAVPSAQARDRDRGHDRGRGFEVTTTADTTDARPGDGRCADAARRCSLRAAVQEANASGGKAGIELRRGARYVLTLAGAGEAAAATGDLDVTSEIRLDGEGATVDAGGRDRAFDVAAGAELAVEHLAVTRGAPPAGESGGAFRSAGTLTLEESLVRDSVAVGMGASGGGVFNDRGTLVVEESWIDGNAATRAGGGIEANAGRTSLDEVALTDNATGPTPGNGGGLHLTGAGTVDVERSLVRGNTAAAEGGGLWNSATGTMRVSRTEVSHNVASGDAADEGGGGLFNDGGRLIVERSEIDRNVADGTSGSGGGILNNLGTLIVERTELERNAAVRAGGGIEANVGTTTLDRVELEDNRTGPNPGNGGGLHLTGAGRVEIDDSEVTGNVAAAEGGGLWNSATGTMVVTDTKLHGNRAPVGRDVFNDGGTFTVDGRPVPVG